MKKKKQKPDKWEYLKVEELKIISQDLTTSMPKWEKKSGGNGKSGLKNKNAKKDEAFFKSYWKDLKEEERHCSNCGLFLAQYSATWFAHLIGKRVESLRHDRRNIAILCQQDHWTLDHADKTTLKIWPLLKQRIEDLNHEYYTTK